MLNHVVPSAENILVPQAYVSVLFRPGPEDGITAAAGKFNKHLTNSSTSSKDDASVSSSITSCAEQFS